ncbi:MAG: DedA family protein [Saprospiraceae bacterium]|nr:DedA family protein [Saprospiraceae bacterium]
MIQSIIDFILHIDEHLADLVVQYGFWTLFILFLIIFCETGLVVTPFLPGDSLLFAAGTLSAQFPESLNIWLMLVLLIVAAILGDTVNYLIGAFAGKRILAMRRPIIRQSHLDRTHRFYEKYGGKTIILARFVPIVRTFAPFVAGLGQMSYRNFVFYNVIGGFLWVIPLTLAGFFFGNIPIVKNNFSLVVLLIIFVSILPPIIAGLKEYLQNVKKKKMQSNS